jgi:nucleolar pre-ribosomal-associated protein 1
MSHITEHPSRAKRRKIDDPKSAELKNVTSNITSAAQLRELLAVQQNAPLAKQGETGRKSSKLDGHRELTGK